MKNTFLNYIANLDQLSKKVIRYGIVIVFVWIGALKFFAYEADGIVPFVANSPVMSFFYKNPSEYKTHMNKEGELVAKNHQWHEENNTYGFSYGLGAFLITLGVFLALYKTAPFASMIASMLILVMTIGTLSFLLTTPESWVPNLGDHQWGFPYLSGRGRLVIKDIVILGGAILTMSESAKIYLSRKSQKVV
ncbi:DUF417 family protein [Pedobacter jamesrossensis]|uniref:DUF417 family protein n=1 Tax=Pedobacter jamesrossensis TaxID=1908238 RepID=A0ABV8NND3_9SPHI